MMKVAVFELQKLPGVGIAIANQLVEIGYTNRGLVATLSIGELMKIRGVGKFRARIILEGAAQEPMGREPLERHWDEPETIDVDFVVKDVKREPVQKVGRVTLDGELDKDELMILGEVYANNRDGGMRGWDV